MSVIVTYDVSGKQTEVKAAMLANGYQVHFKDKGKTYNLPFTTLFHLTRTPEQAVQELEAVCREQRVELLHCLAVKIWRDTFAGTVGEAYRE